MSSAKVQTEDFDVGVEMKQFQRAHRNIGAVTAFVGIVRDFSSNEKITEIIIEHYPEMTEKTLTKIVQNAKKRWQIIDALVIHRIGKLLPFDQIVLVMVASVHRKEAFSACQFIVDYLKTQAPFWKKEVTSRGSYWVDARASDDEALLRWREKQTS